MTDEESFYTVFQVLLQTILAVSEPMTVRNG
jgi:hypothetical protein